MSQRFTSGCLQRHVQRGSGAGPALSSLKALSVFPRTYPMVVRQRSVPHRLQQTQTAEPPHPFERPQLGILQTPHGSLREGSERSRA